MKKVSIKRLISEYINGMRNCNIPEENVLRAQAVLNDFYNTKINNFKETT